MSIKHVIKGSVIVAGGFLATSAVGAEVPLATQPMKAPTTQMRAPSVKPVATLQVGRAQQLINERVADRRVNSELTAIAGKIGRLQGPEVVGAWGLGCGAGCAGGKDFTRMGVSQRASAIKAAELNPADRALLLDINASIGKLAGQPGSLVGAWGLGCGGSCSRPDSAFGLTARR